MKLQYTSPELERIFSVRSEKLGELQLIISEWQVLQKKLRTTSTFRLVVDTNVVLGDLRWLVAGRKILDARTSLMEVVDAGTVEVYAPPRLFVEVDEKIPLIALEQGLDLAALLDEWGRYKKRIMAAHPNWEFIASPRNKIDPDDAEFIALAETIGANGVLSKDKHIAQMGGNAISVDCVVHLRDYSRKTAIELNVMVNGVRIAALGFAGVASCISGVKAMVQTVGRAPNWIKAGLALGAIFLIVHPRARANISSRVSSVLSTFTTGTPMVIDLISQILNFAEQNRSEANIHLVAAMKQLDRSVDCAIVRNADR